MAISLPDILLHWTRKLGISVDQLAEWAERDAKTIYGYMGGKEAPYSVVRRMARRVSELHGDNRVAEDLLSPAFVVERRGEARVNGTVDDDIAPINEALGDLRRAHRNGDRIAYFEALHNLEASFGDLRGEGEVLS